MVGCPTVCLGGVQCKCCGWICAQGVGVETGCGGVWQQRVKDSLNKNVMCVSAGIGLDLEIRVQGH